MLAKSEGQDLDYKQNVSNQQKIAKTILAFANTEGGTIIIGVSDARHIIGIDPEEEMFMVREAVRKYCYPAIPIRFEVFELQQQHPNDPLLLEEKYILLVEVPRRNGKPHALQVRDQPPVYYRRIKDRSVPADFSEFS
ncbi:AlbA family DNA-binding domain-containing protein [Cyclobacterium lianum]|uniref:AlbA family DNA-binding domain-containing protein n=1 Tax=Cyclobacterium lianum TaxID=388280 RepID=UPI0015B7682C|nr:ATP-binding protein [Cyclobacterium lianum]